MALDEDVREPHTGGPERDGRATQERLPPREMKLVSGDQRDARDANRDRAQCSESEGLVVEHEVPEDERECGRDGLEDGSHPRRDELRAPEQQRVVQTEEEQAGNRDHVPVAGAARQRHAADREYRKKGGDRDDEPDRRKAHRRQITKPELDEQPHAAPDEARDPPDKEESHAVNAKCQMPNAQCHMSRRDRAARNGSFWHLAFGIWHLTRRQRSCAVVVDRGALRPASRWFQFRMALKPRKKFPCVSQRQNGRFANITTWPLPIVESSATGWPAIASPPTRTPDRSRSFGSVGNDSSTRGACAPPAPPRPPRPPSACAPAGASSPAPASPPRPPRPPPPPPRPPRPPRPCAVCSFAAGGPSSVVRRGGVALGCMFMLPGPPATPGPPRPPKPPKPPPVVKIGPWLKYTASAFWSYP